MGLCLLPLILNPDLPEKESQAILLQLVTLGLVGITVKLCFLVMGLGLPLIALLLWMRRMNRQGRPLPRRILAWCLCWLLLIMVPWLVRDIFLSGYLAFPCPSFPMPVPWRIPHALVLKEFHFIYSFARYRGIGSAEEGRSWFLPWANRLLIYKLPVMVPLGLIGLMLLIMLIQRRKEVTPRRFDRKLWLFIGVPLTSLIHWFLSAPDPRFAGACFWLVAAGTSSFILSRFGPSRKQKIFLAVGGLMILSVYFADHTHPLIPPGPDHGFYPPPVMPMKIFTTDSGLVLNTPVAFIQCWDAPLPCTPCPQKGLRLRKSGQLKSGFVIDGTGGV
jgi:hypothetical protein